MTGHQQQNINYTIQDQHRLQQSQFNSMNGNGNTSGLNGAHGNGAGAAGVGQHDILIDTSGIPLTQTTPSMHHHNQPIQPQSINGNGNGNGNNDNFGGSTGCLDQQQQQQQLTITNQPGSTTRVAPENQNVVYSVHPAFNLLEQHDILLVRQKADPTSTCCGFESENSYTVRGKDGTPVFKALEYSNCCERCCFEGNREYNLSLVCGDETVARIRKPYRLSRFCCYSNAVRIESPEDNPIGYISQQFTLFGHARYAIFDCQQSSKKPSFLLKSTSCRFCFTPFLCTCLCPNKEFKIISVETCEEVGTISRYWQQNQPNQQQDHDDLQDESQLTEHLVDQEDARQFDQTEMKQHHNKSGGDDCLLNENLDEEDEGDGGGNRADNAVDHDQQQLDDSKAKKRPKSKDKKKKSPANQVFGIQFEPNLEARHKVLLLSACFMMDFFYFENDRRRRKLASC